MSTQVKAEPVDVAALRAVLEPIKSLPWRVVHDEHGRERRFTDIHNAAGDVVAEVFYFSPEAEAIVQLVNAAAALLTELAQLRENIARVNAWISGASCGGGDIAECLLTVRGILSDIDTKQAMAQASERAKELPLKPTQADIDWARKHLADSPAESAR